MVNIAELKERGRKAFKQQKWEEATECLSQVLDEEPSDTTCRAIRSSAYQKQGMYSRALEDANECILQQPHSTRGYLRKACVLRAMKDYNREVDTYLQGLELCDDQDADSALSKGLTMARRLKLQTSPGNQAAKATQALQTAAKCRSAKASQTKTLEDFCRETQRQLQLQKEAIQAKLDLVQEFHALSHSKEDQLDLLYNLLLSSTTIDWKNLQDLRLSMESAMNSLFFANEIEHAMEEIFKEDNNPAVLTAPLTRHTLESFIVSLLDKTKIPLSFFCEFIVYRVLFQTTTTGQSGNSNFRPMLAAKDQIPPKSILQDERMQHLFVLFDKDSDSTLNFKEVALGLYPLTQNFDEALQKASHLLFMVENDDSRTLTYEQFAKFMLAVAGTFGKTFDELADELTVALANSANIDEAELEKQLLVAEEAYVEEARARRQDNQNQKMMDALSYSRTQKLFELWDFNGDGRIDFQELLHGLRKYQRIVSPTSNIADTERDALMIMGYDEDHNQILDQEEFAYAMANYAMKVGTSLHELIDFMCVVTSSKTAGTTSSLEYQARIQEMFLHSQAMVGKYQPAMGTILDIQAEDDDGAQAEDNER